MGDAAFYLPLPDGRFRATAATVGPWSPTLQHGSPPAALLARAIERAFPRDDARIAHLSCQFFGPLAVDELLVETELVRAGKRVEHARARLSIGGRPAMEASAWRISAAPGRAPAVRDARPVPPLPPPRASRDFFPDLPSFGYGESLEWRFVEGSFEPTGPATVWSRARIPLLPDEELSPLGRLLLMVDSANGISAEIPPSRFTFVPVNLTVDVERHPRGEWVGMSARTTIDPDGVGLTRADLFDEAGFLGVALQALFVAPR
jgi:hypothetical protein